MTGEEVAWFIVYGALCYGAGILIGYAYRAHK